MEINDAGNGKLVTLSTAFDTRPKMLHLFYFIVLFSTGTYMLRSILTFRDNAIIFLIVFGFIISVIYIGAYRLANKAVMTEKMLVTKDALTLIRKGIFRSVMQVFDIQKISGFRHLVKPTLTQHPLGGEGFDYLGFETEQKVINDMYGDNQLAFDYEGRTIKFGNNIPSWDFDELASIILILTGKDLTVVEKKEGYYFE